MLALFPLTAKQAKAMMDMQRAQPEIKKLQAKYKNDKQKLNEEVMKFYQENKINPLAGCLPLLVQMPDLLRAVQRDARPVQVHPDELGPVRGVLHAQRRGKAVSEATCAVPPLPNHLEFLGMDLSQHATGVAGGFLDALPYFILVGLVIVTGFLQARQSQRNAPNMNSQMAMITKVLPIGFGLFSLQFPAGLVLYFFVSNLWRLGQQELIMRKITRPGQAARGTPRRRRRDRREELRDEQGGGRPRRNRPEGYGSSSSFPPPSSAEARRVDVEANGSGNGAGAGAEPAGRPCRHAAAAARGRHERASRGARRRPPAVSAGRTTSAARSVSARTPRPFAPNDAAEDPGGRVPSDGSHTGAGISMRK